MTNKHDHNLLASIAVFAELCDSGSNLKKVIIEFIKSALAFEELWTVNTVEVRELLDKHFEFELPEAIVKTCLNSMVKEGMAEKSDGIYSINRASVDQGDVREDLAKRRQIQRDMLNEIFRYCQETPSLNLPNPDRELLESSLMAFLVDDQVNEKYRSAISSFFVSKEQDKGFLDSINKIREGMTILSGLKYSNRFEDLGNWNDELVIYLDTEHLFNMAGYNGSVYQRLFDEFFDLIKEINSKSINKKGTKTIHLKYFSEVEEEIERFFYAAEKIVKKEQNMSPESGAMAEICNGSSSVSDVLAKKADLFSQLKTRGITVSEDFNPYTEPRYNVEDQETLQKYLNKGLDEEAIMVALKQFSKVNSLRRGNSSVKFEKCGHLILSGKFWLLNMSKDILVKMGERDIPFATDIYFLTNRIWFKLNKGFSKERKVPLSLDVITKAQIVLSSQVANSVERRFVELKKDAKAGKIDPSKAQELYYQLREKAKKPEEITSSTLESSLEFIFDNDLEKYQNEVAQTQIERNFYKRRFEDLNRERALEIRRKKKSKKWIARFVGCMVLSTIFLIAIGALVLITYFIYLMKSEDDTYLSFVSSWFTIVPVIVGVILGIASWKKVISVSKRLGVRTYRMLIKPEKR